MEVIQRAPAWAATGVLLPLGLAMAAMLARAFGLDPGVCYDIAWTTSAVAALIGALGARMRAPRGHRLRWTLWAAAAGSWLVGQIAWDVYGVIGFPTSPNLADFGFWGFALLVMASMLRPPHGSRSTRAVAASESLPLLIAAVAFCLAELWPIAIHSHLPVAARVSDLLYPILYASAAILTLQAVVGGNLRGLRTAPIRLVLVGVAAQALGFSLWSSQLLRGTYVPGDDLLDPVWVIGLGAIAVGGLLAARSPERERGAEQPGHRGVMLPAVSFIAMFGAVVTARMAHSAELTAFGLRVGLLCSGAALIARSSLLGRRLQMMLDRERSALRALAERESELARLNQQLVEDSRRDPLTGIGNRRALSDDLPMYEAMQRERCRIAVALCDVDHFKAYNDRLGHLAGDQALRMIAANVRGALRSVDTAYRFGGEELLLVLHDVSPQEARHVAERVRLAVRRAAVPHPDGEDSVLTVSIGVACGPEDLGTLLARADAALYEAKDLGRNRVVLAQTDGAADALQLSRHRRPLADEPVPRHLRSMLTVSRAAASGQGVFPVLDALADAITAELSFQVVVVNLREPQAESLRVVIVKGDGDARRKLFGTSRTLEDWQGLLDAGEQIHGAAWLPAGTRGWQPEEAVWTASNVTAVGTDAWQPEDMLLLPLRGAAGELLGVVSVDQPQLGRRPSEADIGILMAVADHAGLAIDQVRREDAVATEGSDELRLAAVMLLAETLDLRDRGTALHSRMVGQLARTTALALGLTQERVERIHAAGVLHDLGKLGIADAILQKTGSLTDTEWREMRRHPEVGERILEHAGMRDIGTWVRSHHERLDGMGYPDGLAGSEIPLESRILAVCDSYEAMIADRPYRTGMAAEEARAELLRCVGTHFDPAVVDAFLSALDADTATEPAQALSSAA